MFRKEVYAQRITSQLGPVLISMPGKSLVFYWSGLLFLSGLVIYLACASYADKAYVSGYLDLAPGVATVFSLQAGTVSSCLTKVGAHVKQGETMLTLQTGHPQSKPTTSKVLLKLSELQKGLQKEIQAKSLKLKQLSELASKHYVSKNELENFEKSLQQSKQQLADLEIQKSNLQLTQFEKMTAPMDGVVDDILVHEGQQVTSNQILAKILPEKSRWFITLLIPIRELRFVRLKQLIQIRYDAYPYLRYGSQTAVIRRISRGVAFSHEREMPINIKEPFYRVEAALSGNYFDQVKIPFYGMTVQAVLSSDRRTLWQRLVDKG